MQLKLILTAAALLLVEVTTARRCRRKQIILPQAPKLAVIQNAATQNICGPMKCAPNMELVLPPTKVELPCGLGYFASVVPYVASCFSSGTEGCDVCCDRVPVTSPCDCLTIAAPMSPDWAPLVASIIL